MKTVIVVAGMVALLGCGGDRASECADAVAQYKAAMDRASACNPDAAGACSQTRDALDTSDGCKVVGCVVVVDADPARLAELDTAAAAVRSSCAARSDCKVVCPAPTGPGTCRPDSTGRTSGFCGHARPGG